MGVIRRTLVKPLNFGIAVKRKEVIAAYTARNREVREFNNALKREADISTSEVKSPSIFMRVVRTSVAAEKARIAPKGKIRVALGVGKALLSQHPIKNVKRVVKIVKKSK